jgi:hypothetical protein
VLTRVKLITSFDWRRGFQQKNSIANKNVTFYSFGK